MNATDMKKMTAREVVAHIQDMEGRAHRLATENADLRDEVAHIKTENQAMLNALVMAKSAIYSMFTGDDEPESSPIIHGALRQIEAFVGNVETETLTDKNEGHGTV